MATAAAAAKLGSDSNSAVCKKLPMLVIPTRDNSEERRSLYNITDGKIYESQLLFPYNKRCCGSSHGWLAVAEKNLVITNTRKSLFESHYLSPFCYGRPTCIINNADDEKDSEYRIQKTCIINNADDEKDSEYRIQKVILSADPCFHHDNYTVIAITDEYKDVVFIKSGDESWTYLKSKNKPFSDAIYYEGKMYVVDYYGRLFSIDPNAPLPRTNMILKPPNNEFAQRAYIVETFNGDLFLAKMFMEEKDRPFQWVTVRFDVFKVQAQSGREPEWVEVKTLDGKSLFVGDNHSFSILASKYPNCRPNCIYFTDDYTSVTRYVLFGPPDMGVFNLEDGSIGTHYTLNPKQKHMPWMDCATLKTD